MREWPDGWEAVSDPESLDDELRAELAEGHVLHGRPARAIGRRQGYDDFVFELTDTGEVAAVHLTWSRPDRPPWPWAEVFASFDEWAKGQRS